MRPPHTPHKRRSKKPPKRAPKKRKAKPKRKPARKPKPAPKRKHARKREPAPKPTPEPSPEPIATVHRLPPPYAPRAAFREDRTDHIRPMLDQMELPFEVEVRRQKLIDLVSESGFDTESMPTTDELYDYMAWLSEQLDTEIYDMYAMYFGYEQDAQGNWIH